MLKDLERKQLGLFRNKTKRKIAVLDIGTKKTRASTFTKYGLDAVLEELNINVDTTTVDNMHNFDTVLFSSTSPADTMLLSIALRGRKADNLIVGGQGAYAIRGLAGTGCKVFFGRAEGIVEKIVHGQYNGESMVDLSKDKGLKNSYTIRKAQKLLNGEVSVGCRLKCKFCQYSHTRNFIGASDYNATSSGHNVVEDTWRSFVPQTGRVTTALDGWSEETRKKIGKIGSSNDQIVSKLNMCIEQVVGIMTLKVFQIVGYPWETLATVESDIDQMTELLSTVRSTGPGRVVIMFINTPFSPEPLTPMEKDPISLVDWRTKLTGNRCRPMLKKKHIEAFILPQTPGLFTTLCRVAVNRGCTPEQLYRLSLLRGSSAEKVAGALPLIGNIYEAGKGDYCDYLKL
jgi:hypothetical protein